jgi:hypothetical protein
MAQAELTVQCPEADSDTMELPGGSSSVRRDNPILSEMHNSSENTAPSARPATQQGSSGEPSRQARNLTQEEMTLMRLRNERETLWESLGKKQGVKFTSFNMKGRQDEKKKSKWASITTVM